MRVFYCPARHAKRTHKRGIGPLQLPAFTSKRDSRKEQACGCSSCARASNAVWQRQHHSYVVRAAVGAAAGEARETASAGATRTIGTSNSRKKQQQQEQQSQSATFQDAHLCVTPTSPAI
ncbi:hypothetical protein ACSSS7_002688 [Eimeria intestinalis]